MKQKEYFGFGSIKNLKNILNQINSKNIFLVTGRNSYETCRAKKNIEKILRESRIDFKRFFYFSPNPKIEEIERGFKLFSEGDYDCIVGVGGGSAIDVAKSIKFFNFQEIGGKIPLIAIPTTAGSGSEATYFIVYYTGKEKQSKGVLEITLPDYSICDPTLTISLPKHVAASTGMDALSQAIESYWSINSNNKSKGIAEKSIRLSLGNLSKAVQTNDRIAKENMMKAANLAGKAINITKTTACHSIAYPITSYFGIFHGHAAGLTLGEMLKYNSQVTEEDCNDKRGVEYVKGMIEKLIQIIGAENVKEASKKINGLMKNIGLETKLSKLEIDKSGIEIIIKNGFKPDRVKNNPRKLSEEGLKEILNNLC